MFPLFSAWQKGYTTQNPGIKISSASTNSGTGISSAGQGLVDIGTSDGPLSATQSSQYSTVENIPMDVDGIEVVYNLPGFSGQLNLSATVLAQIYQGKITTWNDPAITKINPGVSLPSTKIVTVHRGDSSGSTVTLSQYLDAADPTDWPETLVTSTPTWPKAPGALAETGSGAMVTGAGSTPGSISYVGVSYSSQIKKAKLSVAAIENAAGKFTTATPAALTAAVDSFPAVPASGSEVLVNTNAAAGYPITGYEYAVVNTTQSSTAKADLIQNFLYWALTTGTDPSYLGPVGFVPLPTATHSVAVSLITKITG
jgi:phosphate transport system substrate-binding protein